MTKLVWAPLGMLNWVWLSIKTNVACSLLKPPHNIQACTKILPNMEGVVCKTAKFQRNVPSNERINLLASRFSKASTTYLMIDGKVRSTFKKWMWFKERCQPEPSCPLIAARVLPALGDDAATGVENLAAPPHPSLAADDATLAIAPRCCCPFHRPGVATPADCHPTLILVEWAPRRTTKIHDAEAWRRSLHFEQHTKFLIGPLQILAMANHFKKPPFTFVSL